MTFVKKPNPIANKVRPVLPSRSIDVGNIAMLNIAMFTRIVINTIKRHPRIIRQYHNKVVDHYEIPRNVGSFDPNEKNIGTTGINVDGSASSQQKNWQSEGFI